MKLKNIALAIATAASLFAFSSTAALADDCSFTTKDGKTIQLHGKVEIVEHFGDIKVEIVDNFADLDVQLVDNWPDKCGQVQIVEHFADVKVEIVDHFGDIKVKLVEHFPGKNH